MFDDKSILISKLSNPDIIAKMALDEIEGRLGGKKVISDPNSPFCHLLEFGSSISSSVIKLMDEKLPSIYPKRADSMEDLYCHMSDFDYLSMYSTPSHTTLRMFLVKQHLIDNAIKYNENYKLVRIPEDSVFLLGKYTFHSYYPINILINNYTKTFTTVFDTTEINPLHELTSNVVSKIDYNYQGLDYLILDFPVYQFSKSVIEETLVAETGYTKKIDYNDNFYAIRLFSYKDGKYTELHQSQSKMVYDATIPTALVRVLPDEQRIKIVIPQIYFDNNMLGSKILIEVYTTLGELDLDTSNISRTNIGYIFDVGKREDPTYSTVLKNLPYDLIFSLSGTKITGGSNSLTVDELRERVVNNTLYSRVPITEGEIEAFLNDEGFYVKKYLDNVTDREYHAYRVLRDSTGSVIPSVTLKMRLDSSMSSNRKYSSIIYQNNDNSVTILPTAMYKYDTASDSAVMLTDEEVSAIQQLDKQELADTLNNTQYLCSPFHLRVSFNNTYPQVTSYNLYNPSVEKVMFEKDNYEMTEKMMMFNAAIEHAVPGEYTVYMNVVKSDDLTDVDESDLVVYITTKSTDGIWIGTVAEFYSYDENSKLTTYKFTIPTTYHLTLENEIGIIFPESTSSSSQEQMVHLTHDFHVVFMINRRRVNSVIIEPASDIILGVPYSYTARYVALSRQYISVTLGKSLSDVIKNDIDVSSSQTYYATYSHNIPATYEEDVYEHDDNGMLVYTTDGEGHISINKLHEAGDTVYDENNNIVYKHREGEIMYDTDNKPVVASASYKNYYTTCMFIDAKVFYSDRNTETEFQANLYTELESYFETIRKMQDQLLERTNIYFRCVRSTGYATISRGDGVIDKQNIEMSFRIVCYVPSYVKQSEKIQNQITEMTCAAIEESIDSKTISMLDIFKDVKSKMSDYIDHFDLLGINDDTKLQTFVILDDDSQPSVSRKLELTNDNVLSLNKQINIQYVALDSNVVGSSSYVVD